MAYSLGTSVSSCESGRLGNIHRPAIKSASYAPLDLITHEAIHSGQGRLQKVETANDVI